MNPRHPAWWLLPMFGILLGMMFRSSEGVKLPHPSEAAVESRMLVLPDGRALRFLKGPDMQTFLSQTEIPDSWIREVQDHPLSHQDAKEFAAALAARTGKSLRLPTTAEWRTAARAGVTNTEFPWGFGDTLPSKHLRFNLNSRPENPGPSFGYGFRDLAGGLWEWTHEGTLLGSAWSESNPETLRIRYVWTPPPGYRGEDVGCRLAWD